MEKRRFGRTGHDSSIAIFGAAALGTVTQAQADTAMAQSLEAGVNHLDVAPTYGHAETLLGPWIPRIREQIFLGCKTTQRSKAGAAAELRQSLERLRTSYFDLYQIHAVTSMAELDAATSAGGALEAILEAQTAGLVRYVGITGHGAQSPAIFREALQRYDFDTVLFPVNFIQYTQSEYRQQANALLDECSRRDVGVMAIKAVAYSRWSSQEHTHATWYQPLTDLAAIQSAVNFTLSQAVTGLCTAGDVGLLPDILAACQRYTPMPPAAQEALIASAGQVEPLFL